MEPVFANVCVKNKSKQIVASYTRMTLLIDMSELAIALYIG